ncbi:exported hypothetical protein [Verrucomicrobia bacterium]|nr:exported hypothetical protein [Verrucomicrobiota bacterium]
MRERCVQKQMKKKALFQRNQRLGIPLSGLLLTLLMLPAVAEQRQVLHGHVPRLAAQVQPIGLLPATQKLSLAVGLPLRHQEEFESLLRAIYDPGSPQYRHFLTPQEIAARWEPAVPPLSDTAGDSGSFWAGERGLRCGDGLHADERFHGNGEPSRPHVAAGEWGGGRHREDVSFEHAAVSSSERASHVLRA